MILRAKYVLNGSFQPIDNGFVRVEGATITEVGSAKDMGNPDAIDFGDALLMPGLVNAHTHLELSGLAGKVPPGPDFADWLARLVPKMRDTAGEATFVESSIRRGIEESLQAGTTLLGDISRFAPTSRKVIVKIETRPTVVSFGEVLGGHPTAVETLIEQASDRTIESPELQSAISPHSTYTVSRDTILRCAQLATDLDLPMCIHAAESIEEQELLLEGTGPLRVFLESVGAWDSTRQAEATRPIEFLHRAGALGSGTVLAHCNFVNNDEIDLFAETQTSVAYCPRTHHSFKHPPHRFHEMLRVGVNVCLGTDSLASNPSLSILDEMRFLRSHRPELDDEVVLRMGTSAGADALGLGDRTGVLRVGMNADLVVMPLDPNGASDPIANMLAGTSQPRCCVLRGVVNWL